VASAPDWEDIEEKVEDLAAEFGIDVEDFVAIVCRHRNLIRILLALCGD